MESARLADETGALRALARVASLVVGFGLLFSVGLQPGYAAAPRSLRVVQGSSIGTPGFMAMVVSGRDGGTYARCGATAIAPNVLLTAAHCLVDEAVNRYVPAEQVGVIWGEADPWRGFANGSVRAAPIVRYYTPSNYGTLSTGAPSSDVALLQLRDPAPGVISLVPQGRTDLWAPGKQSAVLGWGMTIPDDSRSAPTTLQIGSTVIWPSRLCNGRSFNPALMLCVGDGHTSGPCHGDSGGPLLVQDRDLRLYVAGVVSFGDDSCRLLGRASVFANLGAPSLGLFVARYRDELQAMADAAAAAAVVSPAPPVQVAQPAPTLAAPRDRALTLATAEAAARSYARSRQGFTAFSSTVCTRLAFSSLVCVLRGRSAGRPRKTSLAVRNLSSGLTVVPA
jgi:secreted trypsin-like serine protease